MKTTALSEKHKSLNAKMAPFAGYEMPIKYSSISDEHLAVRNHVGLFDVSHMGEFVVSGSNALALVQQITSNDASKLEIGDAQYSCMPNIEGGIIDDLIVYRTGKEKFLLVVNASNMEKDWNWIQLNNQQFQADLKDISDEIALLALQGPKAIPTLQKITNVHLSSIKFYDFRIGLVCGIDDVMISATGYTGSGGFELYFPRKHADKIWDEVIKAGKEFNICPCGLGARDTLRLEMGYCLYGNDIDDTTSPLEAGLSWITKLKKGHFNSSNVFKEQKKNGLDRKLIGFTMNDKRVPRQDYTIEDKDGNIIGKVTSGTHSPTLDLPIGMGYVKKDEAKIGNEIFIAIRNKKFPAKVTKLPFVTIQK